MVTFMMATPKPLLTLANHAACMVGTGVVARRCEAFVTPLAARITKRTSTMILAARTSSSALSASGNALRQRDARGGASARVSK
jgi:hypothetical protein